MKRYQILAGSIAICLSLLAACGQTPTATVYNSDSAENASVLISTESLETTMLEGNASAIETENIPLTRYGGDILIDGIQIDYDNFNGHLRVDEGSSHTISLSGFEQYYQDVEYIWTTWQETEDGIYTPIQISDSSEIETDKIYKNWYYGVTINYSSSNIPSITSPELHFGFQFDIENHFRIYPSDADDTTIEQRSLDWFYKYVSFPKDKESISLSVVILGDDLDGVSLRWLKHGNGVDWEEIEEETDTDLIIYKQDFDREEVCQRVCQRVCCAKDKYNNTLYLVFTVELENE